MIIGVILHAIFGAFLGFMLWIGGVDRLIFGKDTGRSVFWAFVLIGFGIGAFSYFVREKKLFDSAPESEAHGRLFWKRALFIIPAAIGVYFIWTFARGH